MLVDIAYLLLYIICRAHALLLSQHLRTYRNAKLELDMVTEGVLKEESICNVVKNTRRSNQRSFIGIKELYEIIRDKKNITPL